MWSAELEQTLRTLWDQGVSARKIADALGCGLSRCAVIGKAHRLDLASRKHFIGRKDSVPRPHKQRQAKPPRIVQQKVTSRVAPRLYARHVGLTRSEMRRIFEQAWRNTAALQVAGDCEAET
jgi:hypothetical protein